MTAQLATSQDREQSALTDFLASHNISARQIREDADQRRQQAAGAARQDSQESSAPVASASGGRTRSARRDTGEESARKRAEEKKAIEKVKASKSFKRRKKRPRDSDDDDEVARAIFETKYAPLPGQMENCGICGKRFTVTPYSLAGPDGKLSCVPCGKELAKEGQGQPKKKPRKQVGGVGSRRALQSRILDGDVGTKSLATLCVQTLARNVDMAVSLGDLPDHLIDKIARLFSKGRLLKPETLPLFAQPTTERLHIYDGASLGEKDFISVFQVAPNLRRFKARCAIQFKDAVMDYVLSRDTCLESFYLHGANLLSEKKWHEFIAQKGRGLLGLQVYYTDCHFGDKSIVKLAEHCPGLLRLKVEHNQKLTDEGVEAIGRLSSLEHVGLQLQKHTSPAAVVGFVGQIGQKLKTLSLKVMPDADDSVLKSIHNHCRSLHKLRITDSEKMTDQGFAELFTGWDNAPLRFVDLQKCRHMDSNRPRVNVSGVGLCSQGFKALMAHSGPKLEVLNVHACRHISREAFEEAFDDKARYPELRKLEISFCEDVTDFVMGCIFRACPKMKEVNVFGCMKVKDVRVPRGVILVGVPNARGMMTEGVD
ncbi:DNA repair protein Rad7, protein [Ophiocordyceps sinensis CO18]|uniref:DNA repair protein Rad7, protein n=1 Tax=Ophiocordyceps sinensis (strain Co18 / CGMCC 3.14243) TaxID=911162 RepID=T4ZZT0_OPHSC|nr:DNA repair protein Rad7, protein [Ophiocordyceps sinensis CO18]